MNEQEKSKNKEIRDALFPDCPIRNILARVGDKWSLLVLYNLQHREPVRFKEKTVSCIERSLQKYRHE